MKLTTNSILILFGIIAFGIMACFPVTLIAMPLLQPAQPNPNDSIATVQAIVTQTMYAATQNAPTAIPATATPIPATSTPVRPTNTAAPTTYCDWVMFVKDVTIPDGSDFAPGEVFTKIWRLQNRGTCSWTPDYDIVFYSGAQMSGVNMQMPGYVAPGQSVDVAVTFTAPSAPGHYVGYWILQNATGRLFGSGANADEAFFVDIDVKNLPHGTVSGSLCYPSEFNPPMTLFFEKAGTTETIQFSIPEAQNFYSVLLPNGKYYAYAWAPNYNLEGAYTDSNGLMKTFVVSGGQLTPNINLCDWSPYPHGRGQ